jgi:hypothetical protein
VAWASSRIPRCRCNLRGGVTLRGTQRGKQQIAAAAQVRVLPNVLSGASNPLSAALRPVYRCCSAGQRAVSGASQELDISPAPRAGGRPRRTIVTWLILPVVICLSQRLSHACLSISNYTAKLRMAHYISYRLLDSTLLLG